MRRFLLLETDNRLLSLRSNMQLELELKARFLKEPEPLVYAIAATEASLRLDCSILLPLPLLIRDEFGHGGH